MCFDYYNNRLGWMTMEIVFSLLLRFSLFITFKYPGGEDVLLVGNCFAHGSEASYPALDKVEILFLLLNTTSKLQPLDSSNCCGFESEVT